MRLTIITLLALLTSCCTACASLHDRQRATLQAYCDQAATMDIADRIADPCGYADLIGACVGLPAAERARVLERCIEEIERVQHEVISEIRVPTQGSGNPPQSP